MYQTPIHQIPVPIHQIPVQAAAQSIASNAIQVTSEEALKNNFEYPKSQCQSDISQRLLLCLMRDIRIRMLNSVKKTSKVNFLQRTHTKLSLEGIDYISTVLIPFLKKDYQAGEYIYTEEELATISLMLEKLVKKISDKALIKLVSAIEVQVRAAWQRLAKKTLFDEKIQELDHLSRPGTETYDEKIISATVGASFFTVPGFSKPFGPYVEDNMGFKRRNQRRTDDEAKVYKEKQNTFFANIRGGCDFDIHGVAKAGANASVTFEHDYIKWKKWKNYRHYTYSKSQKICWANRKRYHCQTRFEKFKLKIERKLNLHNEIKLYKKTQEQAANSQHLLNDYLKNELNEADFQFTIPNIERIKPQKGKTKTFEFEVKGSGGINAKFGKPVGIKLGAFVNVSHRISRIRKYEKEPLTMWDITKEKTNYIINIPDKYLVAFESSGYGIDTIKSNLNYLDKITTDYISTVQRYDAEKQNKSNSNKLELREQKHNTENLFGCIGRQEFLYATRLLVGFFQQQVTEYQQQISEQDSALLTEKINSLCNKLKNPQIIYSKSKLDKCSTCQKTFTKKYLDNTTRFSVNLTFFKGEVEIFHRVRNHTNPLRAGKYLDISLSGMLSARVQNLDGIDLADAIKEIALKYGCEIPADFSILPDIGLSGEVIYRIRLFKPEYANSDTYQGYKGWQNLWKRIIIKRDLNLNLNLNGTVSAGIYTGARFGYNNVFETVKKETLGTHSLIYLNIFFNRYYADSGDTAQNIQWRSFVDKHKNEIKHILINIANGDNKLTQDLHALTENLKQLELKKPVNNRIDIDRLLNSFQISINRLKNDASNEASLEQSISLLEQLLELQISPWKKAISEAWTLTPFKYQAPNDLKTKLLLKMGLHERCHQVTLV